MPEVLRQDGWLVGTTDDCRASPGAGYEGVERVIFQHNDPTDFEARIAGPDVCRRWHLMIEESKGADDAA